MFERTRRALLTTRTRLYATAMGFSAGPGSIVEPGARVRRDGGTVTLGALCHVHAGVMILAYGGDIRIGKRCSINPYSVLYGHGGLSLGDNVRIAAHCVIIPANHSTQLGEGPIADLPETREGVEIGDDVWLGAGVRVLDGTVIESGCVVAAGAVTRGRLRADGIYGGVPAKLIRMREGAAFPRVAEG